MKCTVCGYSDCRFWTEKQGLGQSWRIHRCRGCGFGFVHPRPSAEYVHRFYVEEGDLDHDTSGGAVLIDQQDRRNTILDANEVFSKVGEIGKAPRSAKMLDVGAGIGLFSQCAAKLGFDVTMLELSEERARIATDLVGHPPIQEPFESFLHPPSSFDMILMSQILEHAIDVNQWVSKAGQLLKKGGLLVVAVPNFDFFLRPVLGGSTPYVIPPEHLNYFSRSGLENLLRKHGFAVRATEGSSRIHPSFVKRKLGKAVFMWPLATLLFRVMDPFRRGLFLRAYAEKT